MSGWAGHLARLAIVVACGLFATTYRSFWVAGALALATLASTLAPRLDLGRAAATLIGAFAVLGAWAEGAALGPSVDGFFQLLRAVSRGFAVAALLFAVARFYVTGPKLDDRWFAAWGLLAVITCGLLRNPALYTVLAVAYLVLALAALHLGDEARPRPRALPRRRGVALLSLLSIAAAVAVAGALALPPAHDWVTRLFLDAYTGRRGASRTSGFSAQLRLGSLASIAQSDELVLRVHGEKTDHLRGFVYGRYRAGRWLARRGATQTVRLARDPPAATARRTTVEAVAGDRTIYFAPLAARALRSDLGLLRVDPGGILRWTGDEQATTLSFARGQRDRAAVAPPSAVDLALPRALRPRLTELARRITSGAGDGALRRLGAIERHLQRRFSYALRFERRAGVDPVLDFLTRSRRGHCEYFASAMALLARAIGIPTRVVGGYRVAEKNPVGGYHVVRERDAHAWVEGWIPGAGWRTFDPTPAAALARQQQAETPLLPAMLDAIAAYGSQLWRQLSAVELVTAVVVLLALWLLIRYLRRRRRPPSEGEGWTARPPHPALQQLLDGVATAGVDRATAEPLEQLAGRVAAAAALDRATAARVAATLKRYAAWRYGGVGDDARVIAEVEACSAAVRRA